MDAIIGGNGGIDWILQLCFSHEELRKERDEWRDKYKRLAVEKATIRETKEDAQPSIRPR